MFLYNKKNEIRVIIIYEIDRFIQDKKKELKNPFNLDKNELR